VELASFDPRLESPTCNEIWRLVLSEHNRCPVGVPRNVWHADHNIGAVDAVLVNFPTMPYDHATLDEYRLPLGTKLIPHSFGDAKGW
jgi:dTDP-4-dehydrorhamnose 3,5-epimerase